MNGKRRSLETIRRVLFAVVQRFLWSKPFNALVCKSSNGHTARMNVLLSAAPHLESSHSQRLLSYQVTVTMSFNVRPLFAVRAND